jgi:hypothetical protein
VLTLQAAEVKENANINNIISSIDKIAETIRQKEEMLRKKEIKSFNDAELEAARAKEMESWKKEQFYNENKLEYLESKNELANKSNEFSLSDRAKLLKAASAIKTVSWARMKQYKKIDRYNIPVESFLKIGRNQYAYVDKKELERAEVKLSKSSAELNQLKEALSIAEAVKYLDTERMEKSLDKLSNDILVTSNQKPSVVARTGKKGKTVRLKKGDVYNTVAIVSIDERYVVVKPRN